MRLDRLKVGQSSMGGLGKILLWSFDHANTPTILSNTNSDAQNRAKGVGKTKTSVATTPNIKIHLKTVCAIIAKEGRHGGSVCECVDVALGQRCGLHMY